MSMFQGATQVAITGGTQIAAGAGSSFTINHGQAGPSIALQILSAAAAHRALHDSSARFDAPRCHHNTRTTYLDGLERWMRGLASEYDEKRLIWINGGAGAGKSAIMQSIVERCTQHAVVLGAFFFARADTSRNYAEVLIPTLAYQLACDYPGAMAVLEPIIQHNPLIFKASLRTQAEKLLVHPLLHLVETGVIDTTSPLRKVFVIDGLDECDDREKQAHIIQVVAAILCNHDVPVSFLIASRPETAISRAFHAENRVHSVMSSITLDDDDDARSDIRQFIEDSFLDIRDTHPQRKHIPSNWPHQQSVDRLVEKSSGHFIYAATAMKFISSSNELPQRALQVLEGLAPSRTGSPFAQLDALYLHILTSTKHGNQVLEILRHCILTEVEKSVTAVCFMYPDFSPQDVELFLSDIQALVSLSPNEDAELCISLKHASLRDFFWDENRSNGIYMSSGDYIASLLPRYFMFLFDDNPQFSLPRSRHNWPLLEDLNNGICHSQDVGLLQSLIRAYPPQHIWNVYLGSRGANDSMPRHSNTIGRNVALYTVSSYLSSIRQSAANHDNALYLHYFKTFFQVLMEDLNKLIETEPQYQIIPALIFSSGQRCITTVAPHLMRHFPQPIRIEYAVVLRHVGDGDVVTAHQAYKAIRALPQAQMSWGSDLANVLELVLQHFLGYKWTPKFVTPNPHQRWIKKVKPLKHVAQGSPKLPSAVYLYLWKPLWQPIRKNHDSAQLPSSFYWIRKLGYQRGDLDVGTHDRRRRCVVFLQTITHYLHKCDRTSALAKLARRPLPKAALWSPKLMKKARKKMDAYVRRWEESPDGLLENAQSLTINEMD